MRVLSAITRTSIYPLFTFIPKPLFSGSFACPPVHPARCAHGICSTKCTGQLSLGSGRFLWHSKGRGTTKASDIFARRCLHNTSCMRKNILQETRSNPSPVAIVDFLDDWKSVTCTWTFLVAQSVGIILAEGKTKQVPADCSRKADSQTSFRKTHKLAQAPSPADIGVGSCEVLRTPHSSLHPGGKAVEKNRTLQSQLNTLPAASSFLANPLTHLHVIIFN